MKPPYTFSSVFHASEESSVWPELSFQENPDFLSHRRWLDTGLEGAILLRMPRSPLPARPAAVLLDDCLDAVNKGLYFQAKIAKVGDSRIVSLGDYLM